MTARKGFSTTHRDSHATRHASNTRGRAGARCPRCRSRHVTTMHRRDKSGVPEISLSRGYYFVPTGTTCVYIYIYLSYVLLHLLSLSFLTFSIFLSPVEAEFLIGIDILVARAVIIGMRNGRNFLTSTSPAESRRIASIFAILALFVSTRYLSAKRGRKVFGNSSRYSR